MSDPLSVAGSAVGIISLGIQVCQGLISYLQSFKGQDQDIQDSLNDVQIVISILYSLKGILPKVDKSSSETPAIRRCLAESEEMLREFQQFSLKLRGTQSPEHDMLRKMDHAGRALLYPFREGELKLLCHSLKGLLQNLSLGLNITSLDIAVGIQTNVDNLGNAFQDHGANVAKISDHLQLLDNSMAVYYQDLKTEISQAQIFAQEFRQEIGGQLRLINTDIGSLMSINQRHQEDINQCFMKALDELKEKNNFQNELIRTTLGMDRTSIQNARSRQTSALARTRNPKHLAKNPLECTCKRQHKVSALSYRVWHATFEYEQDSPGQHTRGCRYFGINQPTKRIAKAQLPFTLWYLSSRLSFTCIEYCLGTATPGMSIRYKSIVPKSHSPVYDVLIELCVYMETRLTRATANEISLRFVEAERAILSLYRDRESSPYDQDEDGNSHTLLAFEKTFMLIKLSQGLPYGSIAQSTLESMASSVKRLIETLVCAAGSENGKLQSTFLRVLLLDECRSLARFCLTVFDMDLEGALSYPTFLGYRPRDLWRLLNGSEHIYTFDPLSQAIFQESISMLEIALSKSPGILSSMTASLCVYWPEGLRKLLQTKTIHYLGLMDLHVAILADRIESVDLFLKAGCPFDYEGQAGNIFSSASERCMEVIASNLAKRRLDLLSLAQQHQVICQDSVLTSDIPDDQASYICSCLDKSGISIPLALRVPSSYSGIYHVRGISIYHYPILYRNGFAHLSRHNIFGLLPTMIRHHLIDSSWHIDHYGKDLGELMHWLQSQRIMDQTATDPVNLGLNIQATSWHYLSRVCDEYCPTMFIYEKAKDALGVPVLDNCRCWCTPSDRGCTPLTTALKSYVKEFDEPREAILCDLFHTAIQDTKSSGSSIAGWCIEVVQFLTFEALEMTHTCCEWAVVDRPDISPGEFNALMNCDLGRWQKIRSDKNEEENAALLKTLMEDFIAYMIDMESSPRSLEIFVNGYWRKRMSEIYAVDSNEINDIKNCLVGTKTYVLPDRVRPLLSEDFKLIEMQNLKSKPAPVSEACHEQKVELDDESFELFPCQFCC